MDLITLSATAAAAQTAAEAAGGGGGGPTPPPAIPERTDEHYANTVLLLHGDGNPGANNVNNPAPIAQYIALSDDSPNDRQVSTVGTNVYGTDFNPFYYNNGSFSNSFDGTDDVLSIPDEESLDFGTGNWTIECWINQTKAFSDFQTIWSKYVSNLGYYLLTRSTGTILIGVSNVTSSTSTATITLGKWHHIAVTKNSGVLYVWLDGVQIDTLTSASNLDNSTPLLIGNINGFSRFFGGSISNFKVVKGTAVYTAAFTPPTAPFEDPTTHGELSVYFDGTGDYLEAFDNGSLDLGTGDFTIEAWLYLDSAPHDYQMIVSSDGGNQYVTLRASSVAVRITSEHAISYGTTPVPNEWFHLAVVRSGSTVTVYIDGTSIGTASDSGDFNLNSGGTFIGAFQGPTHYFDGYISNLRVTKQALYTSSFTPSTSPFTLTSQSATSSNVALLTCNGKTFQDYSNYNHALTRYANAHISEFGPFGDGYWSNDFSGDAELVQAASSSDFQLGSSEFTIEGWFYPTTTGDGGYYCIIGQQTHSGGLGWGIWRHAPDGYIQIWLDAGATKVGGAVALGSGEVNVWNHFVAQRDSSDYISFYLNGTRTGYSVDATHSDSSSILGIGLASTTTGWNSSYKFDGYISNIRITKGSALYSGTSITVPTAPYTTTSQGASASEVKLLTCQSNRFIDNSDSAHSLTLTNSPGISELIPFEYLQRQTKLITCQENRFKDIINYRHLVTPSGSPKVSTLSPFSNSSYKTANTGAIYMDGTSFVTIDDQAESFKFGTEDYTYEAWVYDLSTDSTQRTIFGRNGAGNLSIPYVYRVGTSDVLSLYYSSGIVSSTRKIYKGEWTHLALCRENGTSRLFINGELQGSAADTTNIVTPVKLVIGNNGGSSSNQGWIGYFYGVRVEKGRAKYTSNASFNPASTQPALANSANTGAISTNQFSTYWPEDTSADYLANTNPMPISDYAFGINDWTIEGWINLQDTSSTNIIDTRRAGAQGVYPMIWMDASNTLEFWRSGAQRIASRTLSVGKWYHFAFVRSGGTTKLYLNGLKEGVDYADTGDYLFDRLWIGYNTNSTYVYKGWLHGLNILNGVAKYTSNTAITYSPVSRVGTQSANNYSVYFDDSRFISVPSSTDFDYGTGDFTIEAWIYARSYVANAGIIGSFNDPGSGWRFVLDTDGKLRFNNDSTGISTPTGLIKLNNWYHVALTKSSSYINIYINGMRVTYTSNSQTIDRHNSSSVVTIGKNSINNTTWHWDGYISNIRVVKGTALYTGNSFVPATEPFTTTSQGATASEVKLLTCQANTIIDHSNSDHDLTADNGFAPISVFSPFDNGYWSVHFDGTGDFLQSDLPSLGNEWTVQFWVSRIGSGVNSTFTIGDSQTANGFELYWGNSGNSLYVYGTDQILINGGNTLDENSGLWTHYAIVKDTNNDLTLYQNGLRLGPVKTGYNPSPGGATSLRIGCEYYNSAITNYLTGKLSNFKISNTAVYTANTTVPTSPLTKDNNTVFLGCQSSAIIDNGLANSSVGYSITVNGDAKVSRSRPFSNELARDQVLLACQDKEVIKDNSHLDTKFTKTGDVTRSADNPFDDGFWSGDFDSSGDYITIPATSDFYFSGAFTLECWVIYRSQSLSAHNYIIGQAGFKSTLQLTAVGTVGVVQYYDVTTASYLLTGTTVIPLNKWFHIVVQRDDSDTMDLFINGQREATTSSSGNRLFTSDSDVTVHSWNGNVTTDAMRIHGLRISDKARYTSGSSIQVPGLPFESDSNTKLLICQSSNFVDRSNSQHKLISSGNANTRPVFPDTFANTIPQQTTFLTGKFPGSIRNIGFLDESSNNTPIVVSGNPTQGSFTPHYPPSGYWSNHFTADSLKVTTASDFDLSSNQEFSIEFWLHPRVINASWGIFFYANPNDDNFQISHDASGNIDLRFAGSQIGTPFNLPLNTWSHLVITRDSSGYIRQFLNGVLKNYNQKTDAIDRDFVCIGNRNGGNHFLGFISNVRWVKDSIPTGYQTSETSTGTTIFTPPTSPTTTTSQGATEADVKLLTCKSNQFVDESDNHTFTFNGTPKVKPFFPFDLTTSYDAYEHGGSAYFDGSGDELTIEGNNFTLGTSDFTIELWYYKTGKTTNQIIVRIGGSYGVYFAYDGRVFFATTSSGSWNLFSDIDLALQDYAWNHLAFCRNGTTVSIFSNGDRKSTATTSSAIYQADNNIIVGDDNSIGYVCNFRMVVGSYIYDATQSSITVPTSPVRPTTNTVFQLDSTNAGIYDSTGKNNLIITADSRISTGAANTKFGTGSLSFDGTGDYITVANSASESFFTAKDSDFTWEAFVKFNALSGLHVLWSKYGSGSEYQFYYDSSNNDWRWTYHTSTYTFGDADIETGKWYHVAMVKEGTSHTLYRDGRRKGAVATASYPTQRSTLGFVLGTTFGGSNNQLYALNGFLDEVRVTKGLARYSANFTPMTAASGNKSS